ncbi:hypothetical protein [Cellulosilyticum sp. I15G10I2]|uniref:hypothetical protein n=1 Tax=Cellulosilyticum sp. I15G10I2 TaxID=1892843 RepID=UPI00114CF0C1|nr:hypothetical protein [Cellulosilyticum sp. I15G10I2]
MFKIFSYIINDYLLNSIFKELSLSFNTRFTKLSKEELAYQISISLGLIEKNLGKRDVVAAAYPEFKHNASTVALLSKMGVHLQITYLAKRGTVLQSTGIKRIHVSNTTSASELINTLEHITN